MLHSAIFRLDKKTKLPAGLRNNPPEGDRRVGVPVNSGTCEFLVTLLRVRLSSSFIAQLKLKNVTTGTRTQGFSTEASKYATDQPKMLPFYVCQPKTVKNVTTRTRAGDLRLPMSLRCHWSTKTQINATARNRTGDLHLPMSLR